MAVPILNLIKTEIFALKIVELTLSIICTILSTVTFTKSITISSSFNYQVEVIHGTFVGFFINGIVTMVSFILGMPPHFVLTIGVSAVAAILFLVSGSLSLGIFASYGYDVANGNFIGAGIVALVNCVVYIRDMVATFHAHHRTLRNPASSVGV